jgi:hypothetical protein
MSVTKITADNIADGTMPDAITKNASDPAIDTNPTGGLGTVWANTTTGEMFICTDATAGANVWTNVGVGEGNITPPIVGGIITNVGNFRVHTFNESGVFQIPSMSLMIGNTVEYLVLGGGGGGGAVAGGGGGAGRHLSGSGFVVTAQNYTITVGSGGAPNTNGQDSTFSSLTAIGGGGGGTVAQNGNNGASGGGGSFSGKVGGTGVHSGGNGAGASTSGCGGGGGGAGSAGTNAVSGQSGNGGNGVSNSITGTSVIRAGGGGGGGNASANGGTAQTSSGAGQGGKFSTVQGGAGTDNSGSGAGGGGNSQNLEIGGSGVVIIKYQFQ